MNPRILVVGGLAAGPGAAVKAKRTNPAADVFLFEQGDHISYGICEIPYYIGDTITDPTLLTILTPERMKKEKGVETFVRHYVEEIHPVQRMLVARDLDRGTVKEFPYDKLILATGSHPRTMGIAGEEGRNVFKIKSLDEAFALKTFITTESPRHAVVIGAGYVGLEMVDALARQGIKTTLIHRGAEPMTRLEPACRSEILGVLKRHGIDFIPNSSSVSFVFDQSTKVTAVRTSTGTIPCDLVITAIGVEPNSGIAGTAGITRGEFRGIRTDERQATNVGSVYAAGDCCEVRNVVNRSWMYLPLATVASRQARVAGENAAGGSAVFKGAVRSLGVRIFDLQVAQIGLTMAEAQQSGFDTATEHVEANSRVSFFPGNKRIHLVAIIDRSSKSLLGANVFGEDGVVQRANVLAMAIQQRMTVEQLSQIDLLYAPPFSPLWDPVLVLAHQLRKKGSS